ncbi:MAG: pitrilysin family protein [Candidatus Colwellbacteria bacterium]|nr:pitrilysin family protein [Candidatus Colwellbacteria bacterium]
MSQNPYKKTVFQNGVRYIYIPQPEGLATTVLVLVSTGSEYETKDINGISHFLEHLCFKGTKNRPTSNMIAEELDNLGAEYNAFTGSEVTGYYAKAANKNFDKILDVVSDLYLNPIVEQKEMDKERGVIIEEINMYEDLPMEKVRENFGALLYGDQPAGWSIAGRKDVIQKLDRDDVLAYRNKHYVAAKTTVVVAGGISDPEELIRQKFSVIGDGEKILKPETEEKQSSPALSFQSKQTDQAHLVLGVRAFDLFDPRRYALSVMSDILGGGMSSRLFKKVREEMGAAYYIRSSADLGSDCGALIISTGIDKERMTEIVSAILSEMRKLTSELVPEAELSRSKEHISGRMILQLETSDELAGYYGSEEAMTGTVRTPGEILENIRKVTAADIMAVAKDIMRDDRLNLAAIGPFKDGAEEEIKNILKLGL